MVSQSQQLVITTFDSLQYGWGSFVLFSTKCFCQARPHVVKTRFRLEKYVQSAKSMELGSVIVIMLFRPIHKTTTKSVSHESCW